jgi:hypothetical protein
MASDIVNFAPKDAAAVGRLHKEGIRTGFLSRLGVRFLKELYKGIGSSPFSKIFVATDREQKTVNGFAACSLDTTALYRHILLRRGVLFCLVLLPRIFFPDNLKFILQTLFYPLKSGVRRKSGTGVAGNEVQNPDGPAGHIAALPELLSIAVAGPSRGKGIGRQLLAAMESYLKENGAVSYKVLTDSADDGSNAFYRKCGFVFRRSIVHHGNSLNEYIKEVGRS